MPIIYQMDVLERLKEKGYSSYRLRKEKIFGEKTIQALRTKSPVSFETLAQLCEMLSCELSDIIRYEKKGL